MDVDAIALQKKLATEQYSLMDWDRAKRWWSAWLAATSGMSDSIALRKNVELTFFHTDRFDPTAFQQLREQVISANSQ
jgi:hypothetical protein